ncbi:hypothetical protein [Amycolatopsis sp. H20-H5]|uniref:hypothetical protein n=1 Tax=Amycolatopsis sp. H20-H5 TaxID=3046309 RepID=UPI002DBD6B4F|nr:hypothetical protein [Amycolatopsis sp. H20-H5]MEC3975936.1 hypothetical protein [Amycolatopsis sp. H20-H5]
MAAKLQVDRVVDDLSTALTQLRDSMRGMPLSKSGFKGAHDKMARSMGTLTTELIDASSAIKL